MINTDPLKSKKNQKILKVILFIALIVLGLGFAVLTSDNEKQVNTVKANEIKKNSLINEEDMIKSKWIGDVSTDLDIANQNVRETITENKMLKEELSEIKDMIKTLKNQNQAQTFNMSPPSAQQVNSKVGGANGNQESKSFFNSFPQPYQNQPPQNEFLAPQEKKIVILDAMQDSLNVVQLKKKDEEHKPEPKEDEEYLSTGSITKVMILSGFDAPTMSQAKTNPLPILMKILDTSILPNKRKYDLKECFVMGEGYGDLSSERVYIRTNNISCLTQSGNHIDMPFKGMVSGEDGKVGLRGKVVTKQGSLLAKTLIAGFLDGVGKSFQQSQQFTMMGGAGVTTGIREMTAEESLKFGALGGGSKAAEKLADFYLKMADQVSPVIEISAGREVDLISTSLTKFEILEETVHEENK